MDILTAEHVAKSFGEGSARFYALSEVTLQIAKGEFLAILGPSGSGKSTLLHILGGVETPTTGRVLLEGRDLSRLDDDGRTILRRRRIGFVFQRINLLPNLTAIENVMLPLLIEGVSRPEREVRASEMLEVVGMNQRAFSFPATLSGGEQQRVAIARALVTRPALILADEPTGSLDSANGRHITRLLRDLVSNEGHTVVVVTHDAWVASQADRRVQVHDGRLVEAPEPEPEAWPVVKTAGDAP